MRLTIDFTADPDRSVADVTELRWWGRTVRYRVALYAGRAWIRDDTNTQVTESVACDLEAARNTVLGIKPDRGGS